MGKKIQLTLRLSNEDKDSRGEDERAHGGEDAVKVAHLGGRGSRCC